MHGANNVTGKPKFTKRVQGVLAEIKPSVQNGQKAAAPTKKRRAWDVPGLSQPDPKAPALKRFKANGATPNFIERNKKAMAKNTKKLNDTANQGFAFGITSALSNIVTNSAQKLGFGSFFKSGATKS